MKCFTTLIGNCKQKDGSFIVFIDPKKLWKTLCTKNRPCYALEGNKDLFLEKKTNRATCQEKKRRTVLRKNRTYKEVFCKEVYRYLKSKKISTPPSMASSCSFMYRASMAESLRHVRKAFLITFLSEGRGAQARGPDADRSGNGGGPGQAEAPSPRARKPLPTIWGPDEE